MDHVPDGRTILRARARIGTVLRGKWRLEKLLAVGLTTSVYDAAHRNGARSAVKLLDAELADAPARQRFVRDGYLANRIHHSGTVVVMDDDVADDGSVFLVMELLDGESVERILHACRDGRIEAAHVVEIADAVLDVLVAAHDEDIFHGEVTPENLFLTRSGRLKLLGFGYGASRALRVRSLGTMLTGGPTTAAIDARTDVWGVGATMFRLLTGHAVHGADRTPTAMAAAPPIRSIAPALSTDLARIVDRALVAVPEQRWPSARAMRRALRGLARAPTYRSFGSVTVLDRAPGARHGVAVETANRERPAFARRLRSNVVVASVVAGVALAGSTGIFIASDRTASHPASRSGVESTAVEAMTPNSAADDPAPARPGGAPAPPESSSASPKRTPQRASFPRRAANTKPTAASAVAPTRDPMNEW